MEQKHKMKLLFQLHLWYTYKFSYIFNENVSGCFDVCRTKYYARDIESMLKRMYRNVCVCMVNALATVGFFVYVKYD